VRLGAACHALPPPVLITAWDTFAPGRLKL
jgi:hypothetical protein